ncbi:DoxX family protein [Roseomonas sp. BN140053]|uniref:DoxX family protein n=1 Tax=Roseomonas sp. BN140053 TaxID=3391898 RepID=UPI0039EAE92C
MHESRNTILLVARLMLALLFVWSGFGKIFTQTEFAAAMAGRGMPFPEAFPVLAVLIELGGGLLLLLGWRTATIAVLLALFTVVATAINHRFWTYPDAARIGQANNFYKNIAIIGGCLLLCVTGGGRWSLDGWLAARRGPATPRTA